MLCIFGFVMDKVNITYKAAEILEVNQATITRKSKKYNDEIFIKFLVHIYLCYNFYYIKMALVPEVHMLISNDKFKEVIDNLHDEIMIFDDNYKLVYLNKASVRHYGIEPEKLIGKSFQIWMKLFGKFHLA